MLLGGALVAAGVPAATAKKEEGRAPAPSPPQAHASAPQRSERGGGYGVGNGGRGDNGNGNGGGVGRGRAEGNGNGNGNGEGAGSGKGSGGGQGGGRGKDNGGNGGGSEGKGGGSGPSGGGRGSSSGSSGSSATTPPVAVPATNPPAPAPTPTPAPAAAPAPSAAPAPAATSTPVTGPLTAGREQASNAAGRSRVGTAASAGGGVAGAGAFSPTLTAAAGTATAAAALASTATGRPPARSSDTRTLARNATEGSPVARTAERIVSVIPWPMWALIGVLAVLTLALGAHSWIADRQRRRLREDVGVLQSALLPAVPGVLGAVATSAAYRPAEGPGAGGDFYDMFELGDGRVGVVVGDLSGHGREVLPQTALVRYTLRAYLEAGLEPRAALQTASDVLEHQLDVAFATVALATYDPRGRTLSYALAGHPPPLVVGPDGPLRPVTAAAAAPLGSGLPTGVRQTTITLPGRATVCFHTDGLVEARANGELFGERRLEHTLAQLGSAASAEVLLARVAEQADHRPDDMAACVLSLPGAPLPAGDRVEELEVDEHMLAGDRPEQFLLACGVRPVAVPGVLVAAGSALEHADAAVLRVASQNGSLAVHVLPPSSDGLSAPSPDSADERTLS